MMMAAKKIGTHNGTFHCDEVLACFMLKQLAEFKNAEIVRSRDPKLLDECDIVVDVGGVFDPVRMRFDHHQKSFDHSFNSLVPEMRFVTKLSSAGLIYVHFGKEVIKHSLGITEKNQDVSNDLVNIFYERIYERFIEEIDAGDNGIEQKDGKARFAITTTLASRVAALNPAWNDEVKDETGSFYKAMELVGNEFMGKLKYLYKSWWPARDLVKEAITKRFEVDPSGAIISFEFGGCPWKEHLFNLEKEFGIDESSSIKYVIFPDDANKKWMIICVPPSPNTFESRLPLPEPWRGVRDNDLSELLGLEGCIFCHATGFCGGHNTREGVLAMARKSLELAKISCENGAAGRHS